jgi:hypothetical protein
MKRVLAAVCLFSALALAGQAQEEPKFFPKKSFGGYVQFDLAPPHNEWDLNRCDASAGSPANGGVNAPCTAFARWALSGRIEFIPINWGPLKKLYFWGAPRFFFGRNLPQTLYTASMGAIGFEREGGFIYELPWNLEARFTAHAKMHWFGKYQTTLGAADLHGDGPFGQFNTIGIRKNFGTYRTERGRAD